MIKTKKLVKLKTYFLLDELEVQNSFGTILEVNAIFLK